VPIFKHIHVTISLAELGQHRGSFEPMILNRLRDAGIPVLGTFIFLGVSEGTLFHTIDFHGSMVYDWTSEDIYARHILDVARRPRTLGIRNFLDCIIRRIVGRNLFSSRP
jgi:hypothetical protein